MNSISQRAVLVVVVLFLLVENGVCDDQLGVERICGDAHRAINNTTSFLVWNHEVWKCSNEELQSLTMDDDDTVGIASAFELLVIRPVHKQNAKRHEGNTAQLREERLSPRPQDEEIGRNQVSLSDVGRFVGFCEGRLRIVLPEWFSTVLESGIPRSQRRITSFGFPDRLNKLIVWHDVNGVGHSALDGKDRDRISVSTRVDKVFANSPSSIKVISGNVVLEGEWADLELPMTSLDGNTTSKKGIAFTDDAHKYWVSVYNRDVTIPGHVLMHCDKNDVRWNSEVWGRLDSTGFSLPAGNQLVSVKRQGDVVYVIGASQHGVYIEGFDVKHGHVTMRFLSSLAPDSEESQ